MFIYGWRPLHGAIEPIFWHKIVIWVRFPIPPVWGQSASCRRGYDRFTEERSVCLAIGSCQGDKGLSIDDTTLVTVMPEYGLSIFYDRWSPEATPNYQNTLGRPETIFMLFISHCWRLRYLSCGFNIYCCLYLFIYDFLWQLHVWIDPSVRFRVHIGLWRISPKYRIAELFVIFINWIALIACVLE